MDKNTMIQNLARELNQKDGITVIMISHDLQAALRYASHVLHIGDRVFFGSKADYLADGGTGSLWKGGETP